MVGELPMKNFLHQILGTYIDLALYMYESSHYSNHNLPGLDHSR